MDEYGHYDATGLAELVAKGEVTPGELLDAALARVEALNPKLNAIVNLREETARNAIAAGLPDGPFHGVPFLLKDLGAEAVDYPTHGGSELWRDSVWSYDSELFRRIRETGVVVFGRTTSPELGIGAVTESQVYGSPTRNPWNLGHTSGGSSGGTGAAVAAGIVPAAHGSDGGGSVRIPASCCGLVGMKTTRARMPEGPGAGEGWGGMATDGFLTRSLRDTIGLLDRTVGADLGAPYHAPPLRRSFAEAASTGPGVLRIAFCTTAFSGETVHSECKAAMEKTVTSLAELGHEVQETAPPGDLDVEAMTLAWTKIVACGSALAVRQKLAGRPLDPSKLEDVTRGAIAMAETVSGADYLESVDEIHAFGRRMARWFESFDILVTPTLAEPPAEVGRFKPDNDDFFEYRLGKAGIFAYSPFTAAFNASGQPAISLPLHWSGDGLPVGVHLAGKFGEDDVVIALAAQIEEAAPWSAKQRELIERGGIWS